MRASERVPIRATMGDAQLSIAKLVDYGMTAYGDSTITSYDGESFRTATLAEVGERAKQLANGLRDRLGVEIGEPVATFLYNNQEHFECYLAIPSMGAILHTLNVRYTAEQVAFTSVHAADRIIIVEDLLIDTLVEMMPDLPALEHVVLVGTADLDRLAAPGVTVHRYEELLDGQPTTIEWPALPETAPSLMCYTSGTTGDPKGVVYSHRSVHLVSMQICMGDYLALSKADTVLVVVPMFHTNSWNFPFAALLVGASMILPGRHVQPPHLARLISELRPTVSAGVPTVWSDLLAYAREHKTDLSSLRNVVVGGSVCPRTLMEAYQNEFGVRLMHGWGMTEMSPVGTIGRVFDDSEESWRLRMSQGRQVGTVEMRIAGPDGSILPKDGTSMGEVEVRGPWITTSYYRQPDDSRFHDGWLRTGDAGTLTANDVLNLSDRIKDVIKSGGEWVSSIDVELAIETHPDVVDVAVIGVVDDRWGERPLAIVTRRGGADSKFGDYAAHLTTRLDRWQIPERWAEVEALPRTSVGKTDKAALRRLYAENQLVVQTLEVPRPSS